MEVSREIRNQLIMDNMGLIKKIASKYPNRFVLFEDKVNEGVLGFIKAIDKFEPGKVKLTTYAYNWIASSIQRCIQNTENVIKIPVNVKENKDYDVNVITNLTKLTSLDKTISNNDLRTYVDLVSCNTNIENEYLKTVENKMVIDYMRKILNKRDLFIMENYYLNNISMKDISVHLKITTQGLNKIKTKRLKQLRTGLNQIM